MPLKRGSQGVPFSLCVVNGLTVLRSILKLRLGKLEWLLDAAIRSFF